MTGDSYIDLLKDRVQALEADIARARRAMEEGAADARAEALRQLTVLEQRRRDLNERIADAIEKHAENWSDLRKSFQEEIDGLRETFEAWLGKYT